MIYPDSARLWQLLFTNTPDPEDVSRWTSQKFVFSSSQPVILEQIHGGPCGVLAPVQAFVIKELLFSPTSVVSSVDALKQVSAADMHDILLGVLIGIVARALVSPEAPLVFLQLLPNREFGIVDMFDVSTMTVLDYLASVVASRGLDNVLSDMDDIDNPFIGRFGHCSQEVLNLMLFGLATSNVFDSEQPMGDTGLVLRGVPDETHIEIGLLSELEALRYVTVGSKLKNPEYPIWIIGSTTHYTVLFGFEKGATELGPTDPIRTFVSSKMARLQIDDGIMMEDGLRDLLQSLGLERNSQEAHSAIVKEGIVILDDLVRWASPLLKASGQFAEAPPQRSRSSLELFLLNTQIANHVFRVLITTSVNGSTQDQAGDIGGSLISIAKTKWASSNVLVEVV